MKARLHFLFTCGLLGLAASAPAAPRASSNYALPAEVLDAGGAPVSAAHYAIRGSIGTSGGLAATSASYQPRGGFVNVVADGGPEAPALIAPAAGFATNQTTIDVTYSLPEPALANSVEIKFHDAAQ